jgi:hypothetical protein
MEIKQMDAVKTVPFAQSAAAPAGGFPIKIECRDVNVHYGAKHALKGVGIDIRERRSPR